MRRAARILGGTAAWLGCVVGVASASWFAIDSAGRQVTLSTAAEQRAGTSLPTPTATTGASATAGTNIGGALVPQEQTSPTSSSPGSTTGSQRPREGGTAGPWPSGSGNRPRPSGDGPPSPTPVSGSMPTSGGTLELECTGTTATDFNAQPADTWSGQVQRQSADLVQAVFRNGTSMIDISGSCQSGQPGFTVTDHTDE